MCLGERMHRRQNDLLPILGVRDMGRLPAVRRCVRNRDLLMLIAWWKMCGTVIPHCDFQCGLVGNPLFIGIPPPFSSRSAPTGVRPCPQAHEDQVLSVQFN